MIIHRKIGCNGMDVDPVEANEIYMEDAVAERIREPGLSGILSAIYEANNQPHLPLNLFLELTSHCNFSCPFCYVNEPGCQKSSVPRFEELNKILDYFVEKGLVHCTISGGECLIHPDFIDVYMYLKLHGVLVTVFTNGYLLEEKHFRMFSRYKPFKIEISIYGHDDQSYQATTATPKVKAERVFSNVLRLKEDGVNVICKTPLTSLTEESYPRIQQWCQAHDIPFYTGTELVSSYSGEARDGYLASQELRDRLKQEADEEFFSDHERMALAVSEKAQQKKAFDCSGGRHDLFISSEFKVMPCMQAQWAGNHWEFDIKEMGVEAAYNSMVSCILSEKNKPIKGCHGGCKYARICQQCYFTQGQFNRTYCEDLKKYMRGGCNHG